MIGTVYTMEAPTCCVGLTPDEVEQSFLRGCSELTPRIADRHWTYQPPRQRILDRRMKRRPAEENWLMKWRLMTIGAALLFSASSAFAQAPSVPDSVPNFTRARYIDVGLGFAQIEITNLDERPVVVEAFVTNGRKGKAGCDSRVPFMPPQNKTSITTRLVKDHWPRLPTPLRQGDAIAIPLDASAMGCGPFVQLELKSDRGIASYRAVRKKWHSWRSTLAR